MPGGNEFHSKKTLTAAQKICPTNQQKKSLRKLGRNGQATIRLEVIFIIYTSQQLDIKLKL